MEIKFHLKENLFEVFPTYLPPYYGQWRKYRKYFGMLDSILLIIVSMPPLIGTISSNQPISFAFSLE